VSPSQLTPLTYRPRKHEDGTPVGILSPSVGRSRLVTPSLIRAPSLESISDDPLSPAGVVTRLSFDDATSNNNNNNNTSSSSQQTTIDPLPSVTLPDSGNSSLSRGALSVNIEEASTGSGSTGAAPTPKSTRRIHFSLFNGVKLIPPRPNYCLPYSPPLPAPVTTPMMTPVPESPNDSVNGTPTGGGMVSNSASVLASPLPTLLFGDGDTPVLVHNTTPSSSTRRSSLPSSSSSSSSVNVTPNRPVTRSQDDARASPRSSPRLRRRSC
jgi:hypothetical protein